eukprot:gene18330-24792_t
MYTNLQHDWIKRNVEHAFQEDFDLELQKHNTGRGIPTSALYLHHYDNGTSDLYQQQGWDSLSSTQLVMNLAALLAPNQDLAFMLAIMWTALNILMSNVLIRYTEIQATWLRVFRYISVTWYVIMGFHASMGFSPAELLMQNHGLPTSSDFHRYISVAWYVTTGFLHAEFGVEGFSCEQGLGDETVVRLLPEYLPTVQQIAIPAVQNWLLEPGEDCVVKAAGMMDYFHVTLSVWQVGMALAIYLVVLHVMTFGAYAWNARRAESR